MILRKNILSARALVGTLLTASFVVVACGDDDSTIIVPAFDSGINTDAFVPDTGVDAAESTDAVADTGVDAGPPLDPALQAAVDRMNKALDARAHGYCDCTAFDFWDDTQGCMAYYRGDANDLRCNATFYGTLGRDLQVDIAYANCIAGVYEDQVNCVKSHADTCSDEAQSCFTSDLAARRTACNAAYSAAIDSDAKRAVEAQSAERANVCKYGALAMCPTAVSSAVGVGVFKGSFAGQGDDFRSAGSCTAGVTGEGSPTFTGPDVAFLWKPPADGNYVFDTRMSASNVMLSLRAACSASAEVIACGVAGGDPVNPPLRYGKAEMRATLRADTTYTLVADAIGNFSNRIGDFSITIRRVEDDVKRTTNVVHTALQLDVASKSGQATIDVLVPAGGTDILLEVGDLTIDSVSLAGAAQTPTYLFDDMGRRQMRIAAQPGSRTLIVNYHFLSHSSLQGVNLMRGWSYLWPNFCGNLFPCESDTADGSTFSMSVTGLPSGTTAIYPTSTLSDAPSYMAALAFGNYTKIDLGTTTAGTHVAVWHLPGEQAAATAGTAHLRAAFQRAESTYGAYRFGNSVGTVSVQRGGGGMEHHPFWHIGGNQLADESINVHEAMHGWYGDSVRMACWEDFVLSEGTTDYLTWRVLSQEGVDTWSKFECAIKDICAGSKNTVAYPTSCNAFDINYSPLWSSVPYKKGAFFYHRVGEVIGFAELDTVLRDFYIANAGKAVHMQDMVDFIVSRSTAPQQTQIRALAQSWLRDQACPADVATLCPNP